MLEIIKKIREKEEIKKELHKYNLKIDDIKQLTLKNVDGKIYVELKVEKEL